MESDNPNFLSVEQQEKRERMLYSVASHAIHSSEPVYNMV